jgi:ABC-type sugar transport system substrate-binding protein
MKWTTIASVATVALLGCAQWANAANKPYRIGFMVWDTAQPFYSNMMKAARDTAKAEGVSLDIQGGKADLTAEISVVQQFIAQMPPAYR